MAPRIQCSSKQWINAFFTDWSNFTYFIDASLETMSVATNKEANFAQAAVICRHMQARSKWNKAGGCEGHPRMTKRIETVRCCSAWTKRDRLMIEIRTLKTPGHEPQFPNEANKKNEVRCKLRPDQEGRWWYQNITATVWPCLEQTNLKIVRFTYVPCESADCNSVVDRKSRQAAFKQNVHWVWSTFEQCLATS